MVVALKSLILILFIILSVIKAEEEDLYKLLGVSKNADNREIRKAFKELAVKLHPDKNPDDADAQSKFILLTKAYETLKDPDARKHYDLYGDVKSDSNQKQQYQSYTYYRDEFGIYDDDPLIVTLGLYDFESNVNDPNVAWFVNFYSPQCWHCHELAPFWRKLAAELEGVIRIAAVNCQEDWQLCHQLQIRAYPSLLYYSKEAHMYEGETFHGPRNVAKMQDFVLNNLNLQVETITSEKWIKNKYNEKEWLLFLCGNTEGVCPEMDSILKLTAMLDGLVSVAIVKDSELCSDIYSMYLERPVVFWQVEEETNKIDSKDVTTKAHHLSGFDSQELVKQVLALLPELKTLSKDDFQDVRTRLRLGDTEPWLICFYLGAATELSLQLKRLPALIPQVNIGKIHCARNADLCASLHISRYPTYAILKAGGAFEIHHGKDSLHEVVAFARDSSHATNLHALSPVDVKNIFEEGEAWFIDWYAPWCPPCQRLMPELRRASQHFTPESVQFGTVDCTLHSSFCSQHGVRSYPTTAFYNGTKKQHFHGSLQEQSIVDFIQDMVNPVVISLDVNTFKKRLEKKPAKELWIVDFFAPWCGPCQQFAPEYRVLARGLQHLENVYIAEIDCVAQASLCGSQNVRSYPTIRLFPFGSEGLNTVAMYNGHRESSSLKKWITGFLPSPVLELSVKDFKKEILSEYTPEIPWLVDFYAPWCSHCLDFEPEFITVAQKLEGQVRSGKLNCDTHKQLCNDQRIHSYPTVVLYLTHTLRYEIDSQITQEILQRVKNILSTHQQKRVPKHDEF